MILMYKVLGWASSKPGVRTHASLENSLQEKEGENSGIEPWARVKQGCALSWRLTSG